MGKTGDINHVGEKYKYIILFQKLVIPFFWKCHFYSSSPNVKGDSWARSDLGMKEENDGLSHWNKFI